jgi:hypothetical protein
MSPEQAMGRANVDARSDIFSAGILLYEMLSGTNPFGGEGVHAVVMAVLEAQPPRIVDIPPALWDVVAQALRKHPDERYASAGELAEALVAAVPTYAAPSLTASYPRLFTSSVPPIVTVRHAATAVSRWWMAGAIAAMACILASTITTGARRVHDASIATRAQTAIAEKGAIAPAKLVARDTTYLRGRLGDADVMAAARALRDVREAKPAARAGAPSEPFTAAATTTVPTVSPRAQPLLRRKARVLLARDPGF